MKACTSPIGSLLVLVFLLSTSICSAAEQEPTSMPEGTKTGAGVDGLQHQDLTEIDRQLSNVLSPLWSLVFQNNLSLKNGDLIDGSVAANTFYFQPSLPIPVGENKDMVFIARPVFPLATSPILNLTSSDGVDGHVTGLGDIQLLSLIGPNRKEGVVWGLGATFKFPTASDPELGEGKYQAGPACLLSYLSKDWTIRINPQHWMSYAGDDNRQSTNQTEIAYSIHYHLPDGWSTGMAPTITIDWKAKSGDRLTFPIGMGLGKVFRVGDMPVKVRFEVHYSVIHPESFGSEWNFRLQIVPVISNPFR